MPLPHPEELKALKNRLVSGDEWIWLFEVAAPAGGPLVGPNGEDAVLRITPHTVPVAYGVLSSGAPKVYTPWPCRLEDFDLDSKGNVNDMRLVIGNALASANRLLLANNYLRNHKVKIVLTHAALLDNPAAHTAWRGTVVQTMGSWGSLVLVLSAFGFMNFTVPKTLMTPICGWKYRGKGCFFVGDEDNTLGDCKRTRAACRIRGQFELDNGLPKLHPRQFGGFPTMAQGPVQVPS